MNDARLQDLLTEAQKNTKDLAMHRRITAVKCVLINKMTIREAGALLGKAPSWVSISVSRFEKSGRDLASLETRPKSGRPTSIDWDKMMKHLSGIDPLELTCERALEIIHQKTGIRFTKVHIRKTVKEHGFTLKNVRPVSSKPGRARTK